MAVKAPGWKPKRPRTIKAVLQEEQKLAESALPSVPTYFSIAAPPSLLPAKHWCDVTGLPAPYTTKAGVRYHNKEVYRWLQTVPPAIEHEYLRLRKASLMA